MGKEKLSVEERARAAFNRLKAGVPEILPKGSKVNINTVIKEAGLKVGAIRPGKKQGDIRVGARCPGLCGEINSYSESKSVVKAEHDKKDAESLNDKLRSRLKVEKQRKNNHHANFKESEKQLEQHRSYEMMLKMAMFELLEPNEKSKLIDGINKLDESHKVVSFESIKKQKVKTRNK